MIDNLISNAIHHNEAGCEIMVSLQKIPWNRMRLRIEDNGVGVAEEQSRALTAILERNNYSVDAVFDGKTVLEYLEADNYDCVILDIMMPKVDGITVMKEIRKKGSRIPVLMLTAKSEVDDKVLGLDAGANDYLTKPFHSRELLARIRAITRTQTAQVDSRLRFGNVMLDRATFELSTSAGSFQLANKEFQMLELLMSNPHNLISSERFLEKIWGYDSDAELNVVWGFPLRQRQWRRTKGRLPLRRRMRNRC